MKDALVIGGGIIGVTTALELQQRGLKVTLLEKVRPGAGATGAAGGILSPLRPWRCNAAMTTLCALSLPRYRQLLDDSKIRNESARLITSGLLYFPHEDAPDETRRAAAWAEAHHQRFSLLDAETLRREEPGLNANAGFLLPDVCQVDPRALLDALVRTARHRGVNIYENRAARAIAVEKERALGAYTDAGFAAADVTVVCAGAWVSPLLPEPSSCPEVRPVRGQIIEYAVTPGLLNHIVAGGAQNTAMYLIPRRDGHVLVGSTLEGRGFDNSVTETARERLSSFATRVMPMLAQCPITSQWAGLRPATRRETPLIGAHPGVQRLFVNGGHYRNGMALAPASARLAAQLICGETTDMNMKPFELTGA